MPKIINIDFRTPGRRMMENGEYCDFLMKVRTDARRERSEPVWAVYEIRIVQTDDELRLVGVFESEFSADIKIKELESVYKGLREEIHSLGPQPTERYGHMVDMWYSEEKGVIFGFHAYKIQTHISR